MKLLRRRMLIQPRLLVVLVLGLVAGCGPAPSAPVPPGTTWAGDARGIVALLERLEGLSGTPVAEAAEELRSRVEECDEFVAHCPVGPAGAPGEVDCSLPERVECGSPDDPGPSELPERLGELRGSADWIFTRGSAEGHGLILRGTAAPGGRIALDGELHVAGDAGPLSLLLPSAEPPGALRMSGADALIHARLRPDGGLNIARFVEGGDWSARLYRLQSGLFEGATLAGVWELAVYAPVPGELIPPMALALDLGNRELAIDGMERFLAELQDTWPVRRSDFRLRGRSGACLSNVRVMPGLAPCYLTTDDALLVGWNPRSLELALPDAAETAPTLSASEVRVYLDRLPEADAVVAETSGALAPLPPEFYPWRLIEVRGVRAGDHYRLEAELTPR